MRELVSISVLRLRSNDKVESTQAKFLIHTMQIVPQKYCKAFDTQKILPVTAENDTLLHFRVEVRFEIDSGFGSLSIIELNSKNIPIFVPINSKTTSLRCALQNIGRISVQQH